MMKKYTCLLLWMIFALVNVQAQENQRDRNNIIKVNSLGLLFENFSVMYERGLNNDFSASLGFAYRSASSLPSFLDQEDTDFDVSSNGVDGFTLTPEFRWYVRNYRDSRPWEGFYIGLYGRYTNYSTELMIHYLQSDDSFVDVTVDADLYEIGFGLQLGYQMVIKERFTIDFLIFGPRTSKYKLKFAFDENATEDFYDDLETRINDVLDRFLLNGNVDFKDFSQNVKNNFNFANLRYGIAFGFAF